MIKSLKCLKDLFRLEMLEQMLGNLFSFFLINIYAANHYLSHVNMVTDIFSTINILTTK